MNENALLRLENLKKSFDGNPVLKGICLDVMPGEFVTLLGPSGCGKTTTLRIIAGLLEPDAGRVFLDGKDITRLEPEKRDVNTVFQNYALFPHMNVEKNISYGLRIKGVKKSEWQKKVSEMLSLVQLEGYEKRKPSELSGGQKQRISIARVFLKNPPIIILDEATSALDNESEFAVAKSLGELSEGRTTLTIAHRLSSIRNSDRILVLTDDGIVEEGDHDQLMEQKGIYYQFYETANALK